MNMMIDNNIIIFECPEKLFNNNVSFVRKNVNRKYTLCHEGIFCI